MSERQSTLPERVERGSAYEMKHFVNEGLLWLVNSTTFWPRGYSLGFAVEDSETVPNSDAEGEVYGFNIYGDGSEPWLPSSQEMATKRFVQVEQFLAHITELNIAKEAAK